MIILLDIGNTNIKIGIVENSEIVYTWRIASDHSKTADEFGMIFYDLKFDSWKMWKSQKDA